LSLGKEVGQKRETKTQEILTNMDRQAAIGMVGTMKVLDFLKFN
jgi:hypothetical protein